MTDIEIIKNFKKDIYNEELSYYEIAKKSKTILDNNKFNSLKKLYLSISNLYSINEVKKELNKFKKNSVFIKKIIEKYEDKYFNNKKYDTSDERINYLLSINKKIVEVLEELDNIEDKNNIELNQKLVRLYIDRETLLNNIFGYEGTTNAKKLESIECGYLLCYDEDKEDDFELDSSKYIIELRNLLSCISSLKVFGMKSKQFSYNDSRSESENIINYNELLHSRNKKLNNMLVSLFGSLDYQIDFENDNMTIQELLNYISMFNIDKNYDEFKKKYKDNKLSGQSFSKEIYDEFLNKIDIVINSLCKNSTEKIKAQGNKIIIRDYSENKSDVLLKVDNEVNDIINKISKNDKHLSYTKKDNKGSGE